VHGAGVYGAGVYGAGVYEAEVDGARLHGAGVLEAGARGQAQSIYMREPYITEGSNPARFMNTMEEEALYFMLILAHAFRDGHRGVVRLDFSIPQGALL
jgi:hypothetical protein